MPIELRSIVDTDLDDLFAWESDARGIAMAAFTRSDPSDRVAFDAHYERVRNDRDVTMRAIEEDGILVGMIASFTVEGDREVTYWIDPSRWGRGLASRAIGAFLEVETARPLFARVAEHNLGSAKVLSRNGFTWISSERSWANGVRSEIVENVYWLE